MTYLVDARVRAVGEQVTPTEFRSFRYPLAIERTLLRSVGNSTHCPWVGFPELSDILCRGWYSPTFFNALSNRTGIGNLPLDNLQEPS